MINGIENEIEFVLCWKIFGHKFKLEEFGIKCQRWIDLTV